jgi:hypothetical protein
MQALQDAVLHQPVRDAQGAREVIAVGQRLLLTQAGAFRSPPNEPTTCCGRGCNGCVWEGYVDAVEYWRTDLLDWLARDAEASGRESLPLNRQALL